MKFLPGEKDLYDLAIFYMAKAESDPNSIPEYLHSIETVCSFAMDKIKKWCELVAIFRHDEGSAQIVQNWQELADFFETFVIWSRLVFAEFGYDHHLDFGMRFRLLNREDAPILIGLSRRMPSHGRPFQYGVMGWSEWSRGGTDVFDAVRDTPARFSVQEAFADMITISRQFGMVEDLRNNRRDRFGFSYVFSREV